MSVRGTLGGVLAATAVLVVGWQVGANAGAAKTATTATGSTAGSAGSGTSSAGSTPSGTASSGTGSSGTGSSSTSYKDGTYTGSTESTRYGDDQVQVTVSGGRITEVTALQLSDREPRSASISNRAAPILRQEVLAAQSAQVDTVSGATYTSEGYLSSLQSALDQAAA